MRVKFWGTRGSIPVPGKDTIKYGGNTTCLEITLENGREIIIDAGTGMRQLGMEIISNDIKHIDFFLTHSHWDHIQGFPFFAPIFRKDISLNIYGVSPTFERLLDILKGQMEFIYFPVQFKQLGAKISFKKFDPKGIDLDGVKVSSIMTNHPLETHAFKFEENDKTLVFMTDNELDHQVIATTPYDKQVDFVRGANILIHDAQYKKEEIDKYKGWGHSSWQETVALAKKAGVEKLFFTHYDPSRTDTEIDEIVIEANKISGKLSVLGAREGNSFEF
ncbi:MBL fold metallo-hydrolase [candidate division WOR-3 bacterium]|nr:MBL fold metallo-hydrolase [candidate division WOR-3 bacterium]MCK4525731.1 MBL fold metallo-hydrolase [candidate division WOR-3 bacterium]